MPQTRTYNSNAERQRAYRERLKQAEENGEENDVLPDRSPIPNIPSEKRWRVILDSALQCLKTVDDEMDDYEGARSGAWQESERGQQFVERMVALNEIVQNLESFIEDGAG